MKIKAAIDTHGVCFLKHIRRRVSQRTTGIYSVFSRQDFLFAYLITLFVFIFFKKKRVIGNFFPKILIIKVVAVLQTNNDTIRCLSCLLHNTAKRQVMATKK